MAVTKSVRKLTAGPCRIEFRETVHFYATSLRPPVSKYLVGGRGVKIPATVVADDGSDLRLRWPSGTVSIVPKKAVRVRRGGRRPARKE